MNEQVIQQWQFDALSESAMQSLAGALAQLLKEPLDKALVVYLQGDLGAGKTTFCRFLLNQLGHKGAVKSPTYTLVEPYEQLKPTVYHFDLYRLAEPEELEYMGIRDYFSEPVLCLLEWPDKGRGYIAAADVKIEMTYNSPHSRNISLQTLSDKGQQLLRRLDFPAS